MQRNKKVNKPLFFSLKNKAFQNPNFLASCKIIAIETGKLFNDAKQPIKYLLVQ
jgi:hypothetical protein